MSVARTVFPSVTLSLYDEEHKHLVNCSSKTHHAVINFLGRGRGFVLDGSGGFDLTSTPIPPVPSSHL